MSTFKIKATNVEQSKTIIKMSFNRMKQFSEPLETTKKILKRYVEANFQSEGETFGKKWKQLAPSTVIHKRYLRREGQSIYTSEILKRTGMMEKSFTYNIIKKRGGMYLEISNSVPYFIKHQSEYAADRTITLQGLTTKGKHGKLGKKKIGRPKKVVLPRRIMIMINKKIENELYAATEKWLISIINTTTDKVTKPVSEDGWEAW